MKEMMDAWFWCDKHRWFKVGLVRVVCTLLVRQKTDHVVQQLGKGWIFKILEKYKKRISEI